MPVYEETEYQIWIDGESNAKHTIPAATAPVYRPARGDLIHIGFGHYSRPDVYEVVRIDWHWSQLMRQLQCRIIVKKP